MNELYKDFYGEEAYLNMLQHILDNGDERMDRTKTGTKAVFGTMLRFDVSKSFPIFTTKRVPFKLVISELLWFLRGDTNIQYLVKRNNHIWNEWAFKKWVESDEYKGPDMTDFGNRCLVDEEFNELYQKELASFLDKIINDDEFAAKYGDLGDVYGRQWRAWDDGEGNVIDQIKEIIHLIKTDPSSRRLIVNAWNVGRLLQMALPPCHYTFQFFVRENKYLDIRFIMRSVDSFLGLPFNIPSYAALLHLIARECGLEVGELVFEGGDTHIYSNHVEQVKEQLSREIREMPQLHITEGKDIFELDVDDFTLVGYNPHPTIKAPIAV